MTKKSLPTKLSLFLGVAALLSGPTLQAAQQTEGNEVKGVVGGEVKGVVGGEVKGVAGGEVKGVAGPILPE